MGDNSDDNSHEDYTNDEEQQHVDPPQRRRGRGVTKLPDIVQRQGTSNFEPLHVDFTEDMIPLGPNRRNFVSYLGFIARSRLSILIDDWRFIRPETRDRVWTDILQNFTVPNTEAFRRHWMREVRRRWKDFKSTLTREYVRGPKRNEDPCLKWPCLNPEDWQRFKASRLDPEFQEKSKKQQEKQKLNIHPHTMSRGGYLFLEEKMITEQLRAMEEAAQSDPSIVVEPPPPIPRHRKWSEGRKRGGKYINPEVEKVAQKIDELEEQSSQGSFSQTGRMDILATALGKPDPPGRVRGEYGTVGLKKYFGHSRRTVQVEPSQEVLEKLAEKIRDQVMQQVRGEMRMMQTSVSPPRESPGFRSTKSSCTKPIDPPGPSSEYEGRPCFLHLDVPNLRAVAKATQYPRASTIHNIRILEDQVKVFVVVVVEGEESTIVPIPTEEVANLGDAVGYFILWPRRLVFDTPVTAPLDDGDKYASLSFLYNFVPSLPEKMNFRMDPGVVGPEKTYPFGLGPSDVVAFLSMDDLDLGWLELAIQCFHDMCRQEDLTDFAFLSSMALVRNTTTKNKDKVEEHNNDMQAYAGFQVSHCKKKCYFAPILDRRHWSLCVICPDESCIYWFDSLSHFEPNILYKRIFTKAVMHWHIACSTCRGSNKKVEFIRPTCPQQPGNTECGYYVIRFMYDIIRSGLHEGLSNIYDGEEPFDQDTIDIIRDKLASWLLQTGLG